MHFQKRNCEQAKERNLLPKKKRSRTSSVHWDNLLNDSELCRKEILSKNEASHAKVEGGDIDGAICEYKDCERFFDYASSLGYCLPKQLLLLIFHNEAVAYNSMGKYSKALASLGKITLLLQSTAQKYKNIARYLLVISRNHMKQQAYKNALLLAREAMQQTKSIAVTLLSQEDPPSQLAPLQEIACLLLEFTAKGLESLLARTKKILLAANNAHSIMGNTSEISPNEEDSLNDIRFQQLTELYFLSSQDDTPYEFKSTTQLVLQACAILYLMSQEMRKSGAKDRDVQWYHLKAVAIHCEHIPFQTHFFKEILNHYNILYAAESGLLRSMVEVMSWPIMSIGEEMHIVGTPKTRISRDAVEFESDNDLSSEKNAETVQVMEAKSTKKTSVKVQEEYVGASILKMVVLRGKNKSTSKSMPRRSKSRQSKFKYSNVPGRDSVPSVRSITILPIKTHPVKDCRFRSLEEETKKKKKKNATLNSPRMRKSKPQLKQVTSEVNVKLKDKVMIKKAFLQQIKSIGREKSISQSSAKRNLLPQNKLENASRVKLSAIKQ